MLIVHGAQLLYTLDSFFEPHHIAILVGVVSEQHNSAKMGRRVLIKRSDKILEEALVFRLLDEFIMDSYKGRRTKKNGCV